MSCLNIVLYLEKWRARTIRGYVKHDMAVILMWLNIPMATIPESKFLSLPSLDTIRDDRHAESVFKKAADSGEETGYCTERKERNRLERFLNPQGECNSKCFHKPRFNCRSPVIIPSFLPL